jgi:hypothetical protein
MPVWNIASISTRPSVTLADWTVFEVALPRYGGLRTRHLAGWSVEDRQGLVCYKLDAFDPSTVAFLTQSGRVYKLAGRTGLSSDAQYVLNMWMRVGEAVDYVDINADVRELMAAAQGNSQAPAEGSI